MLKNQIKKGIEYAMREKRVAGAPLERVRVLEHIRGTSGEPNGSNPTRV